MTFNIKHVNDAGINDYFKAVSKTNPVMTNHDKYFTRGIDSGLCQPVNNTS